MVAKPIDSNCMALDSALVSQGSRLAAYKRQTYKRQAYNRQAYNRQAYNRQALNAGATEPFHSPL
jgi:hypothetical protein